jgi:parallel beta-helix repeat protein
MAKLSRLVVVSTLAVTAVLLGPGPAQAATTWTYPSAACPQSSTGLDNCINNVASDGETISIVAGVYHEAGTTVTNEVTVTGPLTKGKCKNATAVKIIPDQSGDGFYVQADNVTIQCLEIDHPGSSYDGVEDDGGYVNLHILNVIVQDAGFAVYTHAGAADGLQVKNSTFRGTNSYGIRINDEPDAVKINGDLIRNAGSDCVYFQDGATNATISNNTMTVCNGSGIYLPGGGGPISATGNIIRAVDSTGIDIDPPDVTINGNTIDTTAVQAIFFSGDNATVTNNILMGTIGSNAAIEGDCAGTGHDTVTISGNVLAANSGANGDFICARYDNATIKNNTANGFANGYGIHVGDSGSDFANAVITGNKLLGGVTAIGIYVWGDNLKVNGNMIANAIGDGMDLYCTTDVAADCSAAEVKNNVQSGAPSGCYGIYLYTYGTGLTVSGNQASNNTCYGLYFDSNLATSSLNVTNNLAKHNGYATEAYGGFIFASGGGNTITGNKANNNGGEGIYVYTDGNTLSGNTTKNNVLHGVEISETGDSNTVNANTSSKNAGDGFNNDGTNTSFTNNTASLNDRDCTNDVGEGATLGTVSGNSCADGHVFDWETLLTDE